MWVVKSKKQGLTSITVNGSGLGSRAPDQGSTAMYDGDAIHSGQWNALLQLCHQWHPDQSCV